MAIKRVGNGAIRVEGWEQIVDLMKEETKPNLL